MDYNPPGSYVHETLQAKILEWIAMPSFKGSPQAWDQTQVFCIAGGFFTISATWEALIQLEQAEIYNRPAITDQSSPTENSF